MIVSLWHRNIYDCFAINVNRSEIAVEKDISAYFLTIVKNVEEVCFNLVRVGDACYLESRVSCPILMLGHTQKDYSAAGIGECGISFPY